MKPFTLPEFNVPVGVEPMEDKHLTRDSVRERYARSGLADVPLTFERLRKLRDKINRKMLDAGLMDGTLHMKHTNHISVHKNGCAELRCESYYFDSREAVTFNSDGFVGFAGWADKFNVMPILEGFDDWISSEFSELSV